MVEEIAALKAENARLNQIISVLLEQIALLKQNNGSGNSEGKDIIKNTASDITDSGKLLNKPSAVISDNGKFLNNTSSVISDNGKLLNKSSSVISDSGKLLNDTSPVNYINGNILNNIEVNDAAASRISGSIKKHLSVRVRRATLRAIAKEILTIHNNGFASPKQLKQVSGLSGSGFDKHIIMLRRIGLVKKESWQKFILTDASKQILNETFGKQT